MNLNHSVAASDYRLSTMAPHRAIEKPLLFSAFSRFGNRTLPEESCPRDTPTGPFSPLVL
jgi:hypothetical protein